ncbi:hypothetical protein FBQ81_03255 [Chloroflexi bacterium CFX6]|nr:hypothetical protein [Chloroflexi bacterium CFX6]
MAIRYLLMPLSVVGNRRGPKYLMWRDNPGGLDVPWNIFDFGLLPQCIAACDVTTAQFNGLNGNADVFGVPSNIDGNVTAAALNTVRTALETVRIPADWVQAGSTSYRELLRVICGLAQFAQRHHAMHGQYIIPDEINLDQTWGDLPDAWRANLRATADSFHYDYSQISAATPVRAILRSLANQWGDTPFYFGIATL